MRKTIQSIPLFCSFALTSVSLCAQLSPPAPADIQAPAGRLSERPAPSAQPPWMNKRVAEWSEQDAWQVLSDSPGVNPWVKKTPVTVLRGLSTFERRDGGNMNANGGGKGGVGLDDFSLVGKKGAPMAGNRGGPEQRHVRVSVRWESAMPIRAAELRAHESGVPELEGDEYAIAVYGVDLKLASPTELKGLGNELKKVATLKVDGKREINPSRVVVVELGDSMATVIYLFPRSANITLSDERLTFSAQIGLLAFAQYFFPGNMIYQGALQL